MPSNEPPVPQGRVRRTMPLAGVTARAPGGRAVPGLRGKAGNPGVVDRFHERTAERYAQLLGHSKGVLMKAGQIFSMIDPATVGIGELSPYQRALTRLQADAPPMDPQLARSVLEAAPQRPVEALSAEFTDHPIAAASIGQVHRATLHDGREVAVKVQYPGIAEALESDLRNAGMIVRLGKALAPGLDAKAIPDELRERILEELDYEYEAQNQRAFARAYKGHPYIYVPKVHAKLSRRRG